MFTTFDKAGNGYAPSHTTAQNGLVLHPLQNVNLSPAPWYQRLHINPSIVTRLPAPLFSMPNFFSLRPSGRQ